MVPKNGKHLQHHATKSQTSIDQFLLSYVCVSGVRNASFSENLAYALNEWSLSTFVLMSWFNIKLLQEMSVLLPSTQCWINYQHLLQFSVLIYVKIRYPILFCPQLLGIQLNGEKSGGKSLKFLKIGVGGWSLSDR